MRLKFASFIILLVFTTTSAAAQFQTCSALVGEALAQLEQNCNSLERNTACYGYYNVEAGVIEGMGEAYFTQPADLAALATLTSIRTMPYDPANNSWGVAAMRLQANLPDVLPGQAAIMILMGEAIVEDAVGSATMPLENPISAQTTADVNFRSGPGLDYPITGSAVAGSSVGVDGTHENENYAWVRVVVGDQFGWMLREFITPAPAADALPLVGPGHHDTPMQAFYFSTGVGQPTCQEAPDLVMVQGPERTAIDIQANGAEIRITSTIALRTPTQDQMQIIAISGTAILENGLRVPRGFTATIALDDTGRQTVGEWSAPRLLTVEEAEMVGVIGEMSPSLLHYLPRVPVREELPMLAQEFGGTTLEAVEVTPEITPELDTAFSSAPPATPQPQTRSDNPQEAPVLDPIVPAAGS
ncbi:MAG: hypothetical protein OHK0046_08850 [Anaerolineae bacterium]